MNEIDRRIAELVMGEEEPQAVRPSQDEIDRGMAVLSFHQISPKGNWEAYCFYENGDIPEWHPLPFSSVLEEALRAWDKYVSEFREKRGFSPELVMSYQPAIEVPFKAGTRHLDEFGRGGLLHPQGQTLPEAICNLLLALKEKQ